MWYISLQSSQEIHEMMNFTHDDNELQEASFFVEALKTIRMIVNQKAVSTSCIDTAVTMWMVANELN